MKAIVISREGQIEVIEKDKPEIGDGEVLIKIKYVGFAGLI